MNFIRNFFQDFNPSNCLKVLGYMVASATFMALMGVQNWQMNWFVSSIVICGAAKAVDAFSAKREAIAQSRVSAAHENNVILLADYRHNGSRKEVAA